MYGDPEEFDEAGSTSMSSRFYSGHSGHSTTLVCTLILMVNILTHYFLLYMYVHVYIQGLKDLVLSLSHQTQSSLAAMNMSIQAISSELINLKERLDHPKIRRRKVHRIF